MDLKGRTDVLALCFPQKRNRERARSPSDNRAILLLREIHPTQLLLAVARKSDPDRSTISIANYLGSTPSSFTVL